MFLHYFLSGLLYRFTTIYVYTLLFIRITVSIHNNLCFYINFLSGLLYRFTTTYVSSLLFIRITVSIHNNLCFYISFYQDYCIDSQQLMFLHLIFIRITVSIHNNLCFYIYFNSYYCIDSQQLMFLHFFLSGLLYRILYSNINGIPQLSMLMWNMGDMVFNDNFNNISFISWRRVLLEEESGLPGENHRPVASHWQTLSRHPRWEIWLVWDILWLSTYILL
jgi:hypothetical protein